MINSHAVLVLAAGSSRRLGRDKAGLQRSDGRSFLQHVIATALQTDPLQVCVVRRAGQAWPVATELDQRVQRVDCADAELGMSASLRCGLLHLHGAAQAVLVLLLDQPALDLGHLQRLIATWQARPDCAVASVYADVRGAPALLPQSSFAALESIQGDVGARHWLRSANQVLEVPAPALAQDVDQLGDWLV